MKTNKPEVVAIKDSDVGGLIELKPVLRLPHGTRLICLTDYERLQAECEELRKDAERYRFLCNPSGAEEAYLAHAVNTLNSWADKIEIDQAVDSAMRERYHDN